MIELRDELLAAPVSEWRHVPFTAKRHKWWLRWYRRDDGEFFFSFVSPKKRCYTFYVERGKDGGRGRVTDAEVARADGVTIASYWEDWGDSPVRLDAVMRHTPKYILRRLFLLLDSIA